ncbi:efflux RND transporter periplasmic adaptor subunit [Xanthomonas albilineans]|uniref:efflux RND transporter periplasmic adaptor subunit n=1 Tax=Xanthomonas albilineans TaxID=29447 RepID=UPI0005F30530|nr:efflux RND transporter periplasmic adaptor subunit [Xanthomonas albilineans]
MIEGERKLRAPLQSLRWCMIAIIAICIIALAAYRYRSAVKSPAPALIGSTELPVIAGSKVICTDWQRSESFSGVVRAAHRADLSSDTAGIIEAVRFESGASVQTGEILVQLRLNDGPDVLAENQADLKLAEQKMSRASEQLRIGAISQEQFDTLHHAADVARARLAAQRARIGQRSVRAPFAGTLGIRKVDPGQFIQAGDVITTIDSREPLLFDFSIPQSLLPSLSVGQRGHVEFEGYAGRQFDVVISSLPPIADPQSHSIAARATFVGDMHALASGMFGRMRLDIEKWHSVKTVPRAAILSSTHGDTLYLLRTMEKDTVAHQVPVSVKADDGDRAVVEGPFKCSDRIVVNGQIKIEDGTHVVVAPHE